jgi:hypothetical protein
VIPYLLSLHTGITQRQDQSHGLVPLSYPSNPLRYNQYMARSH